MKSDNHQTDQEIRKGFVNAQFNEENSSILIFEIAVAAISVGLWMHSWWWGGGTLLGLIIALQINFLAIILVITLSFAWGAIGYAIGIWLFQSQSAEIVLAIIGLLAGLGSHLSGLAWFRDLDVSK